MPELSGEDLQDLHGALLDAFPTIEGFAQLLTFRLGANLQAIAGSTNLSDAVFKVVNWAETTGRMRELVVSARAENPGNERLAAVAGRVIPALDKQIDPRPVGNRLRRALESRIVFAAVWSVALIFIPVSTFVQVPADVDLRVDARLVSMRLGGTPDTDNTLISGMRLASLTIQNLGTVAVTSPGSAEVTAPGGTAALTADQIGGFTLAAPGHTLVQFETAGDEPNSLKVLLRDGSPSALFKAGRIRPLRCSACDSAAADQVHALAGSPGGAMLRVQGSEARTALLLSTDEDTVSLRDVAVDVADTLSFAELLDQRLASTIVQGQLKYKNAALADVLIERGARLRLADLKNGTLTLSTARELQVQFVGRAGALTLVEGNITRDLRPTVFATLLHQPTALAVVFVLLAVVSWFRLRPVRVLTGGQS